MNEPLKICPFCGNEPMLNLDVGQNAFYIYCDYYINKTGIPTNCGTYQKTDKRLFSTEKEAIEHAIKRWNKRA